MSTGTGLNLVQLFTINGAVWVDTHQLASGKTHLRIFTARGKKLSDTGRTKAVRENAAFGVHRENLFASPELAEADFEKFFSTRKITVANPL